jgi:hypothetical protein
LEVVLSNICHEDNTMTTRWKPTNFFPANSHNLKILLHGIIPRRGGIQRWWLGEFTPSYILDTRAFGTYLLRGLFTLQKNYKVMVFYMWKPENIIYNGILHVNMFHYFKIPYFTCTFFTKFTYNKYIGPYFLSHVVLRCSPVNSPRVMKH